jgi:hypothetical protein
MEFSLKVDDVTSGAPNVITLKGDIDVVLELPLDRLGISISKGNKIKLVIHKEKDQDLHKYKIYAWGIVYYVGEGITRISIGGLQLDIKKELPLKIGEKVYVGLI